MSAPLDRRDQLDRERTLGAPQTAVNHASAAVRLLEKRVRRLEAVVFPRQQQQDFDRSSATEVRHSNGERHASRNQLD